MIRQGRGFVVLIRQGNLFIRFLAAFLISCHTEPLVWFCDQARERNCCFFIRLLAAFLISGHTEPLAWFCDQARERKIFLLL